MNIDDHILVFNSGSSSLKFQLFGADGDTSASALRGIVRDLGDEAICEWVYHGKRERTVLSANDQGIAAGHVLALLEQNTDADGSLLDTVSAIGHRIVHGGDSFFEPTLLTDKTLAALDTLSPLAPLHNPPALAVIRTCQEQLPDIPMAGVFDTAFFHALPDYVRAYALPAEWTEQSQPIRRYGFHGLAHRYMAERFSTLHTANDTSSRVITLQLGHGCSVASIRDGRAIETSMGFTPLEGLLALEIQGHAGAHLAVEAFCHRARKYIGAYLAVLGGADAIVFGGGIGEHAPDIRARICDGMDWCGLQLDEQSNRSTVGAEARISTADASIAAYVIPVDEEALIARDTLGCLGAARTQYSHLSI